jgi:hypothetical protein
MVTYMLLVWLAGSSAPPFPARTMAGAEACGEWKGLYEAMNSKLTGAPYRFKCQKEQ